MGTRPTGRSRPEGEAVRRPGVRASGLEGEGAKGRRVSSGAKRRASHGDRRDGASRRCRPDEGKRTPAPACLRQRRSQAAIGRTNEQTSGASAGSCGRDAGCVKARDPVRPCEARSLRERAMRKGGRMAKAVTAQRVSADGPKLKIHVCADERSVRGVSAVAEPSVEKPEARQSERSEVCRDRAKEKYLIPDTRPVPGASEQSEVAPGTGNKKEKTGGPRQSPRSVCLPSARSSKFMFTRTSGASGRGAVRGKAPGSGSQSEAMSAGTGNKGKYLQPEGRAGRREAVVRRCPEAEREPPWGADGSGCEALAEAARSAAPWAIATAREGGGTLGWRRCTKPVRSDASARPRRLQRRHHPRRFFDLGCGAN